MKKNIIPNILPVNLLSGIINTPPMESELLYFVPDGASGITVCNSGVQNLKEYWASPTMKSLRDLLTDPVRLTGLIAPLVPEAERAKAEEGAKKASSIIKAVLDSQLVKAGMLFNEYVQYQYSDGISPLPVSMALGTAAESLDYKVDFEALKSAGVPILEESAEGYTFYVFDYNTILKSLSGFTQSPGMELPDIKMYFSSHGKKFGVGNSKEAIVKYFKEEKLPKKPALLEDPQFKTAMSNLPFDSSRDFCQSYIDFKSMMLSSMGVAPSSAGSGVEAPEMNKLLDNFPITSVAQVFGYKGALVVTQQWGIKDSVLPEEAKIWIEAFKTGKSFDGISVLPVNAAIALAWNGEVFEKLKAAAEKSPQTAPFIANVPYLDLIVNIENFNLAVLPPSSGVIWPESVLTLKLSKSKELYQLAKEQIQNNASKGGLANFKWLEKQVNGNTVNYFSTPLGVGLFISEHNGMFTMTSSEPALNASFSAADGKTENLKDKLKKMGIARDDKVLSETFVSLPALLAMGRTVQTSLAMLMPVNVQISKDYDIIANALGEYYFTARINAGYVTFTFAQKPV